MSVDTTSSTRAGRRLIRVAQLFRIDESMSGLLGQTCQTKCNNKSSNTHLVVYRVVMTPSSNFRPSCSKTWTDMKGWSEGTMLRLGSSLF